MTDFLDALKKASGSPIADVVHTYDIEVGGRPVRVELLDRCKDGEDRYSVYVYSTDVPVEERHRSSNHHRNRAAATAEDALAGIPWSNFGTKP